MIGTNRGKLYLGEQHLFSIFSEMRGGKDTAAAYMMKKIGYPRVKLAYGDALKRYYHEIFGQSEAVKERNGYQWFGQTARFHKPTVWIDKLDAAMQPFKNEGASVFVTDMRQPNEFAHLKGNGFVMIKIETPEHIRIERMKAAGEEVKPEFLNHETEKHISKFPADYIVDNSKDLEHMFKQLDEILRIERGFAHIRKERALEEESK